MRPLTRRSPPKPEYVNVNFPSVRLVGFFRDGRIERPADGHPQRAAGDRDVGEVHADGPARLVAVHVLELEPSREIRRRVEPDRAENVEEVPARAQWPETQSHLTLATCGRRDEAVRLQEVLVQTSNSFGT